MKSEFLTPLNVEYMGYHRGAQWWKLTRPLAYFSEEAFNFIVVPEGFVCDFASVKRVPLIWWLWGSKAHRAAVIHDYLYREGTYGRKGADIIFFEAMKATDYRLWSRCPMYWAVRLFGGFAYKTTPGCMDYRFCSTDRNPDMCVECENYRRL